MITLRQRLFIIIGIVVGIILAGVFLIMWVRAPKDTLTDPVSTTEGIVDSTTGPLIVQLPAQDVAPTYDMPPEEFYIKNVSRIFVERFGTYSNQNGGAHLEDVIDLATPTMQSWIRSQKVDSTEEYEGMTTRVLTNEIVTIDTDLGTATVHVGMQRTHSIRHDAGSAVVETIDMREGDVLLENIAGEWKISGFFLQ